MIGPFINSAAIFSGGVIGVLLRKHIPKHLEEALPQTFSLVALTLGVRMVIEINFMPAIVLALIIGTTFGSLLKLETGINRGAIFLQKRIDRFLPHSSQLSDEEFSKTFATLLTIFCASSLGIIGALSEGVSGDYQFLLVKAILDLFTALIFAISMGIATTFLAIPQLLVQGTLFFLAKLIMPYMDEMSYGDFSGCAGIIMIAVGLRMAGIKNFHVVNFIPALLIVIPFSYLWRHLFS